MRPPALFLVLPFAALPLHAAKARQVPDAVAALPTGQRITPLTLRGARFEPLVVRVGPHPSYVADGASAAVTSPNGRELLVLTSGFNRFNGSDGKVVAAQSCQYALRFALLRSGAHWLQTLRVPNAYGGLAWLPDGRGFIVGGGMDDTVHIFERSAKAGAQSAMRETAAIALNHAAGLGAKVKPQAAGVAVSPDGRRALVANYYNDSLTLLDLVQRRLIVEQDLRPGRSDPRHAGEPGGENPFAVSWTDSVHAWVSAPRDRQLLALSVGPSSIAVDVRIATVGEPTALLADQARGRLYVTEDNDDRLAVIDLASRQLVSEPRLRLPKALGAEPLGKGLNPNNMAELPNGGLLVTLGGVNALAFIDPSFASRPSAAAAIDGLVPTGWYPSAVAVAPRGARIFVVNRKSPPGPNPQGCAPKLAIYRGQPDACGAANQYIFQLEKSGLLQFPMPDPRALAMATLMAANDIGLNGGRARAAAEAAMQPIRQRIGHVVFIIKENRTYDQVLGDLEVGNGDPHLAILGAALSPNHHALAREFVTLDDFLDSGEQSSTGWTWSTAGRTTDLLEKTAPVNYAQRGLAYEAEEADRFIYVQQTAAQRKATNPALSTDPDLLPGPALLTAPDPEGDDQAGQGFLWDAAIRAGLSVRNYGFSDASIYDKDEPGAVPVVREPFKAHQRIYTPGDRLLANRSDPYFRGFDQKLPDYWRVVEWRREFDAQDAAGAVPALTLLRLSHDHFGDFKEAIDRVNTVETEMADNDYALGLVVERIARSRVAGSTLIFVIEDDAQNGADHVDARRSVALVVGPYVRQGALVSTRYTTLNVLRTIEAVLGLAPLGLNDGLAAPMADLFDPSVAAWSFKARAAEVLRSTALPIAAERFDTAAAVSSRCGRNTSAWWTQAMRGQDFRTEDHLDTSAFNAALWKGLGPDREAVSPGDPKGGPSADLAGLHSLPACAGRRASVPAGPDLRPGPVASAEPHAIVH